ncbi:MAG: MBL fold metallo-hydrolase [Chloroflexi bacterium]|nr:MBL fold metallo-hydrolase [Chloroflexota bacterium]
MAVQRFSYEPERVLDDFYCIPLPLHDGSPVNAFVCTDHDGVWLIDGGLDSEHCQATLRDGLQKLGFSPSDVRGILITHGHTDHVGMAPTIAANGGTIAAHELEATVGRRLAFDENWLHRNGLPSDTTPMRWGAHAIWPDPTRFLNDGEVLRWGNLQLQVLWCPGHTPGLVCLYDARRGLVFTTDHVMRRARAPVSLRFDSNDDPLAAYLASVRKLGCVEAATVLPGHGRPFGGLSQRLRQIEHEIAHDLEVLMAALRAHGPATAYRLLPFSSAAGDRRVAERYALSLLLARLRHLERAGQIVRADQNGAIHYAVS